MSVCKLTIFREFAIGAGATVFLCLAPQNTEFWPGILFAVYFTVLEVFPDFHWVPAITAFQMLSKKEDTTQGLCRIAAQFISAILGGIIGYQLLDSGDAAYPKFEGDDWRNFVWMLLIWSTWLALTNHAGNQSDGFRRNLAHTAAFVSANYVLQAVGADCMLNGAVNFGKTVGAKIYLDDQTNGAEVDLKDTWWLLLLTPFVGAVLGFLALKVDDYVAGWAAPAAGNEETTAVYGSTGNKDEDGDKKAEA